MKKTWLSLAIAMVIAAGFQGLAGISSAQASGDRKVQVVTTLFPLYDWARAIGGEQAEVVLLLPPGVEAHSFEPTPRDIVGIHKADLLIYTGRFMEPWVENIRKGVRPDGLLIVDTSRGILKGEEGDHAERAQDPGHSHESESGVHHGHGHEDHSHAEHAHHGHEHASEHPGEADHHGHDHHGHDHQHGGQDPHIWLEFGNAQIMVDHIAQAFAQAQKDPERARLYIERAAEYKSRLKELDARYEKALASCKHRTLIYAGHFAFGYFAERYGLTHVSPYQGFSPDAEPTPGRIAELVQTMKALNIQAVFYEEGVEPRVARTIARETGAKMLLLHGAHNVTRDELKSGVTYLSIMEENLARLKEGLECP